MFTALFLFFVLFTKLMQNGNLITTAFESANYSYAHTNQLANT